MCRSVLATLLAAALLTGCSDHAPDAARNTAAVGTLGRQPGQFSRPRAVAVTNSGEIVTIDRTGRVQLINLKTRQFTRQWRLPGWDNGTPTGVVVDPVDDTIWIADTHYQQVLHYDQKGTLISKFGERGEGPGQMIFPTDLAPDPDGKMMWVCEYGRRNRIMQYTREGQFIREWGPPLGETEELQRPMAIRLSPDGTRLFVADAGNNRINVYDREGQLVLRFGEAGSEWGEMLYPYDLSFAPDGSIYVVEYGNSRVSRWSQQGEFLGAWGHPGRAVGELATPWGCAVASDGTLVLADTNNQRLQLVDSPAEVFTKIDPAIGQHHS